MPVRALSRFVGAPSGQNPTGDRTSGRTSGRARGPGRATLIRIALLLPVLAGLVARSAGASAPVAPPRGPHPRIALAAPMLAALKARLAGGKGAVAATVDACRQIDPVAGLPSGYQGQAWAFGASACAMAYQLTGDRQFAARGVKLWRALLEDVSVIGDRKACVRGATPAQAIAAIERDTGYAIRFIGPYTALAYDWLHDAPGADEALRLQSRECFRRWSDWYTSKGYLATQPGANYHAGFALAKTLIAIAVAGEDGREGDRIWREVVDDLFARQIVANGLAGDNGGAPRGAQHGVLVGGDWAEGWQYGPLSVLEYAFAARALAEQGATWPETRVWAGDLATRFVHGLMPTGAGTYVGGDFEDPVAYSKPSGGPLLAVIVGPSSDASAAWASAWRAKLGLGPFASPMFEALAEGRRLAAAEATPPPASAFLARGTRNLYARSDWSDGAYWAVFTSSPRQVDDHQHPDASNFVFSRGADPLIVDPSPYGSRSSLTANALTVDSNVVRGAYKPSQTDWSEAELPWARSTRSAAVAARADLARAFNFGDHPSDVPLARRDWVFLPEGEVVTIDRVHTGDAARGAYLRFRSPAVLSSRAGLVRGVSGHSALAIHPVLVSPAARPSITAIAARDDCGDKGGACTAARVAVGEYALKIAGPEASAIHVIDGLAVGEAPAEVASLNAPAVEGASGANRGVIGAAIGRAGRMSFVVAAASASDAPPTTLAYAVPGRARARHVVFDAPEDGAARAAVSASATPDQRCRITLSDRASPGSTQVAARPAMFWVGTAAGGCAISEDLAEVGGVNLATTGSTPKPRPGGAGGALRRWRQRLAHLPHKKHALAALVLLSAIVLAIRIRGQRRASRVGARVRA